MTDRRQPRTEAALAARLSLDGFVFHPAVATSIGAGGFFLRTVVQAPVGSRVWAEVGLGPELEAVRSPATVVYVNRVFGSELVAGLGLALDSASSELGERLERFLEHYPGAFLLARDGRLGWPFDDALRGAEEEPFPEGLWLSSLDSPGSSDREPEAPNAGGAAAIDADDSFEHVQSVLATELDAHPGQRFRIALGQWPLAPRSGVSRQWLREALADPARARILVEALTAQLHTVRALRDADCRLDRIAELGSSEFERAFQLLVASMRCLEVARPDPVLVELSANLSSLVAFVHRLLWAVNSGPGEAPSGEAPSGEAPSGEAPSEELPAEAALACFRSEQAKRLAAEPCAPRLDVARRPDWFENARTSAVLRLVAFVVLPLVFGFGYALLRYRTEANRWQHAPPGLVAELPGHAEGDAYHVELDRWTSFEDSGAVAHLMEVATALAESGYNTATFRRGACLVATWKDGAIRPGSDCSGMGAAFESSWTEPLTGPSGQ